MNSSLRKKIAKRIIWSMNMKPEETLSIRGGTHEQELVEETALLAMEKGVHASISTVSDDFTKSFYKRVPVSHMKKTSRLSMKMVEALDNIISLEKPKDPDIYANIPHEKIAASIEGGQTVSKKMDKYKVKWCFVGYPSEELAKQLGVSMNKLNKYIFGAMLIDYKKIVQKSKIVTKKLANAEFARITDEHGSDLTLRLGKRKILVDDGYISETDKRNGDIGLNLPAGEVFTTPLETCGDGILISPKRRDLYTEKMIENIKLVFEGGKLNLKKCRAEKNWSAMEKSIRHSIAIDSKKYKTIRTTNVAELGIGLNPVITDVIGYLLTDEKVGGTIHVAIGKNKNQAYGGKNESSIHWDFVTHRDVTLEVMTKHGRTETILEKGKIVK